MNFFLPFLAPLFQTGGFLTDKIILSLKKVSFKTYSAISFPLTFFITFIFFLIFQPPISFGLILQTWPLLLISIGIGTITNFLLYKGMEKDNLSEIETIDLFRNIPAIIFSSILFVDERNIVTIIAAIIGSIAVIWSHWEHHHFKIAKQTWPFFAWMITIGSFDAIFVKMILTTWHPISFVVIRSALQAIIFGLFYFHHIKNVSTKGWMLFFLTNFLASIAGILFLFSYQNSGIVFTILLISLQPLLVYLGSLLLLKEKFHWKKALAFIVILLCLFPSQIFK